MTSILISRNLIIVKNSTLIHPEGGQIIMVNRRPYLSMGEIYHVYNRSVAKQSIFNSLINLSQILDVVDYYRFKQNLKFSKFRLLPPVIQQEYFSGVDKTMPLVEAYAFSFMPNHYHFLTKQLEYNGISKFISLIQNSFAKYFNLKNNRNGSLFQTSFKAKRVRNLEEFIHISRYIHLNPITSFLIDFQQLEKYPWTSYSWYINKNINRFINTEPLLSHFKSIENYSRFVKNQVDYQRKLKFIKDILFD